jgi:hypothetical protein
MVIVMATSKRTRIGNRYVTRKKGGQFKTNVDVGRSLSADRRIKSKNTVKAGHGHQGDIKRAEGGCSCGANSSMSSETFAACGCGSKKKAESFGAEEFLPNGVLRYYGKTVKEGQEGMFKGAEVKIIKIQEVKKHGVPSVIIYEYLDEEGNPLEIKGRFGMETRDSTTIKDFMINFTPFEPVNPIEYGAESYGAEGTDSYSRSTELGQVNNMQATQSWQNSEPYATLEGYNPVDSVVASPPLGRGVAQDFGSEQGYNDKMGMRHSGKHSQSMKYRRNEASAMDRRHSSKGRKWHDRMTMDAEYESLYGTRQTTDFGVVGRGNDFAQNRAEGFGAEYDSPYGTRQTTDFGMVGQGHDFAQNRAEGFSAEDGSQFMTGARYGAGAILGITGATVILGMVMRLFVKE